MLLYIVEKQKKKGKVAKQCVLSSYSAPNNCHNHNHPQTQRCNENALQETNRSQLPTSSINSTNMYSREGVVKDSAATVNPVVAQANAEMEKI